MSTPKCPGILTATYVASMEMPIVPDADGNLDPTEEATCIDILEAYTLYCSECGMLTASEYEYHRIADDWEML